MQGTFGSLLAKGTISAIKYIYNYIVDTTRYSDNMVKLYNLQYK